MTVDELPIGSVVLVGRDENGEPYQWTKGNHSNLFFSKIPARTIDVPRQLTGQNRVVRKCGAFNYFDTLVHKYLNWSNDKYQADATYIRDGHRYKANSCVDSYDASMSQEEKQLFVPTRITIETPSGYLQKYGPLQTQEVYRFLPEELEVPDMLRIKVMPTRHGCVDGTYRTTKNNGLYGYISADSAFYDLYALGQLNGKAALKREGEHWCVLSHKSAACMMEESFMKLF